MMNGEDVMQAVEREWKNPRDFVIIHRLQGEEPNAREKK